MIRIVNMQNHVAKQIFDSMSQFGEMYNILLQAMKAKMPTVLSLYNDKYFFHQVFFYKLYGAEKLNLSFVYTKCMHDFTYTVCTVQ